MNSECALYNEQLEGVKEELATAVKALKDIAEFGKANPGCGFTCAKMAEKATEGK